MSEDARARIIEGAKRKAREFVEEARKVAETIIGEAEENWRRRAEAERSRILREASVRASAIVAEAKKTSSFIVGKAKEEVVEKVYEKVYEIIKEGKYDVEKSLKNLLKEALGYVEKPARVIVRRDHVHIAKKVLGELGYDHVEVEGSDSIVGGLVLISNEGVVVDNTLETRLKQSRSRLLHVVARTLLGED